MDINFEQVAQNIKKILLSLFSSEKPAVVNVINGYIADAQERIANLAIGAASGQLSYAFVIRRLKEEAVTIKDIMLSTGEIVGSDLQNIINQVIAIYQSALNDSVKVIED